MAKFVCTTLRPSQLVYTELYDLDGAAQFVADFLSYEPLEDPLVRQLLCPRTALTSLPPRLVLQCALQRLLTPGI